jgi:hypothetical protein
VVGCVLPCAPRWVCHRPRRSGWTARPARSGLRPWGKRTPRGRSPLRGRCCPGSHRSGRRPGHGPSRPPRRPRSCGATPSAPWPGRHRGRPPAGPRSRCGGPAAAPDADPRSRRSGTLPGPQPQRLADAMATGHAQVVEGERATASWRRLEPPTAQRRAVDVRLGPALTPPPAPGRRGGPNRWFRLATGRGRAVW